MENSVKRFEKDKDIYFTISWSALKKADRFEIIKQVPAFPGIYEIYYLDKYKKLNRIELSFCWHDSLRNIIRTKTDPSLQEDPRRKYILDSYTCYYRYIIVESYADILDIIFYLEECIDAKNNKAKSSGRYESINVKEVSPDKIMTVG